MISWKLTSKASETMSTPRGYRKKVERPRMPGAPYSVEQVAAELNLAPYTVRKRITAGLLRAYKDGALVRVTEESLAEYKARTMGEPINSAPPYERRFLGPRRSRMA
jgi:excisionase family DNA binding protein